MSKKRCSCCAHYKAKQETAWKGMCGKVGTNVYHFESKCTQYKKAKEQKDKNVFPGKKQFPKVYKELESLGKEYKKLNKRVNKIVEKLACAKTEDADRLCIKIKQAMASSYIAEVLLSGG